MKNILKIAFISVACFAQAQIYSGGIETATGFKISDPQPIDDRTVVADSLSLLDIPNKYAGLTSYSIEDDALFTYNGSNWNRVKTEIPDLLQLGESSTTAYRGDRGKTAYDHTLLTDNPHSVSLQQTVNESNTLTDSSVKLINSENSNSTTLSDSGLTAESSSRKIQYKADGIYFNYNGKELLLYFDEPTDNNNISFPDASGKVALTNMFATVAFSGNYENLSNTPTIPAQFNPIAGSGISISGSYPNLTISNSSPNIVQDFEDTLNEGNMVGGTAATAGFTMSSLNEETGESYNTQVNKGFLSSAHRPDGESDLTTLTMSGFLRGYHIQIGNNEVAKFGVFNNTLGLHFYDFFENTSISLAAPTKTGKHTQLLQDKSGTVALLSDITDSFSAIEKNSSFTLNNSDKNKQILVTCNDCSVTIPNDLDSNFNVTLDFSGTGATIIDESSATGDGDHTTSPYNIPQNGMIYIYKTESGTVRIKGDIL